MSIQPTADDVRKKVLVVMYSQTGQLSRIVERMLEALRDDPRIALQVETLHPATPFPFPWSLRRFFDTFPESALLKPAPIAPLALTGDERFDLIILPWQVWFLAPSQPMTAFLQHPAAQRVLRDTPVVSVIACRNMWIMAHEKFKGLLAAAGARLIDNVVFTDRAPTLATLLTTPLWMLTGRRDVLRSLPPAGISDADIADAARFGPVLRDALASNLERGTAPLLTGLAAVEVNPHLMTSEKAGTRSFFLWGKLLHTAGPAGSPQRMPLLVLYAVFLVALIITVVPVSLLLQRALRPLLAKRLARIKEHYEQPSGSGTERLSRHER
ncbi:dialkylrecorsinol condensing enzyme [Viridibacterium curvum]|uniref:Dialkylrecorsinol condensing enzyme n=1 Tax=Viridibacterium curvum TaxID=1101404 RepID=A0ABP9R2E5_9RHOO